MALIWSRQAYGEELDTELKIGNMKKVFEAYEIKLLHDISLNANQTNEESLVEIIDQIKDSSRSKTLIVIV